MFGLACDATATSAMTLWGFCVDWSLGYAVRSVDGGRNSRSRLAGDTKAMPRNSRVILPCRTKRLSTTQPSSLYVTRNGGAHFGNLLSEPAPRYDLQIAFASLTTWSCWGSRNRASTDVAHHQRRAVLAVGESPERDRRSPTPSKASLSRS